MVVGLNDLLHGLNSQYHPFKTLGASEAQSAAPDVPVFVSHTDFQRVGPGAAGSACYPNTVLSDLFKGDLGEVRHTVWRIVAGGIVDLVNQLL